MIADPQFFDDDRLPRTLFHRGSAVDTLTRAFEPATHGEPGDDIIVTGGPGVGKTTLVKHTLERSQDLAGLDHAYVPALGLTTAGILRSVLMQLPGPDPDSNTAREDLDLFLHERVNDPAVVVLDEAKALHATDGLERLLEIDLLSVVVICHDPDRWLSLADPDVREAMRTVPRLEVTPFRTAELADILGARAQHGLDGDPIGRSQLERIADDVGGVARRGIQVLRAAATVASERAHVEIHDGDIEDAYDRADRRILELNLASLPVHHHILYEIVRESGPIQARYLHDHYDAIDERVYGERAATPICRRHRRNALDKLRDYDLLQATGPNNQYREYSVADPRVQSQLDMSVTNRQRH